MTTITRFNLTTGEVSEVDTENDPLNPKPAPSTNTDYDGLVERLRKAEAENERLKAELAEAHRVIEPFADAAGAMDLLHGPLLDTTRVRPGIYMSDLRRARSFLNKQKTGEKG